MLSADFRAAPRNDENRRDGRVVEGARLESVYRGNSIEGSNPSLSAIKNVSCGHYRTTNPRLYSLSGVHDSEHARTTTVGWSEVSATAYDLQLGRY
jgi:hypothetical protein